MNFEKLIAPIVIGYFFIAVLTFGIAYNKDYQYTAGTCIWCSKSDEQFDNCARSILDAMFWPIYLSTNVFEFMRKPKP